MSAQEFLNRLTIDDYKKIMDSLEVDIKDENDDFIIYRSACHSSDSYKLYLYKNSKAFMCYSHCGNMSLYDVVIRVKNIEFKEAINYIKEIVGNKRRKRGVQSKVREREQQKREQRKVKLEDIVYQPLEPIKKQFLYEVFPNIPVKEWCEEGITKDAMKKFNIRFDKVNNRAIIPHHNENGKLVGIRVRNFDEKKILKGKYIPLWYDDISYAHPLGRNLYGYHISKENIAQYKIAFVFESEKSCMLYESYYPNKSLAVATCGSSFSSTQKKILLDCGVDEIVLCYDKEFETYGDEESVEYENKLRKQLRGLEDYCKISYIIDKEGVIDKKDSPIDCGKDIFEKLLRSRILIN